MDGWIALSLIKEIRHAVEKFDLLFTRLLIKVNRCIIVVGVLVLVTGWMVNAIPDWFIRSFATYLESYKFSSECLNICRMMTVVADNAYHVISVSWHCFDTVIMVLVICAAVCFGHINKCIKLALQAKSMETNLRMHQLEFWLNQHSELTRTVRELDDHISICNLSSYVSQVLFFSSSLALSYGEQVLISTL